MVTSVMAPPAKVTRKPGRHARPGGGEPPRDGKRGYGRPRSPRCDKCHVAAALYEVVVNSAECLYLYLCGHHMQKMWADVTAHGYEVKRI